MKRLVSILALALGLSAAGTASAQFTVPTATYTATELAAITTALNPTSLTSAIDKFDSATTTMGHPRLFKGQADYAGVVAAAKAERAPSITSVAGYLKRNPVSSTSSTVINQLKSADETTRMASWWQQARILEGMAEAAVAYYFTKDTWFLTEMRARMNLFGPAILARNCSGDVAETRDYVWFFALAYDFTFHQMTTADRKMVRDVITSCGNAGLVRVHETVVKYPENGIAFNALGKFVGALLIVRGEHSIVHNWLKTSLPVYVASVSPWGGDDGGFANGSSYAEWTAGESLIYWDLIERVLGVPFYKKPWVAEFSRFIAYALPPGTPAGVFGDGAEVNRAEEWARFGKAIMNRSDTTLSRWYGKQQSGEDYARLHIILSPREYAGSVTLPSTQPNGAYFPVVGWAAMHSSMTDRQRTSVFFKSSPFGSVNHSHADQNSFVFYSKGKVLAMDSGVYDYYNSPHWRDYYKQTKAHNAITFDGGQGQSLGAIGLGERASNGKLTKFLQNSAFDITAGDATAAYAGKLTRAKRTVVFIRPSTMVTIDQVDSATARKYEYNLHTGVALTGEAGDFKATVAPAEMCGTVASPEPLAQTTSLGYWPAPTLATSPHYWNKFAFKTARQKGLIVSVLRSDCSIAKPRISFSGNNALIMVANRTVTVTDEDVTVK